MASGVSGRPMWRCVRGGLLRDMLLAKESSSSNSACTSLERKAFIWSSRVGFAESRMEGTPRVKSGMSSGSSGMLPVLWRMCASLLWNSPGSGGRVFWYEIERDRFGCLEGAIVDTSGVAVVQYDVWVGCSDTA